MRVWIRARRLRAGMILHGGAVVVAIEKGRDRIAWLDSSGNRRSVHPAVYVAMQGHRE